MSVVNDAMRYLNAGNAVLQVIFGDVDFSAGTQIDLSIGNPDAKPPAAYYQALQSAIEDISMSSHNPHAYLKANESFGCCEAISMQLSQEYKLAFTPNLIQMTVGATNALDVFLKTILYPPTSDDSIKGEVIILAPYFIDYLYQIQNNFGKPVIVQTNINYLIDIDQVCAAITSKTKAIIVNSPNNPTGRVYPESQLIQLADLLRAKNSALGINILVIEDRVYDTLVFSGKKAASIITHYEYVVQLHSFSKKMSIAGERIGYLAISPRMCIKEDMDIFIQNIRLNIRATVFHAPSLPQRILAKMGTDLSIKPSVYRKRTDRLTANLLKNGFNVFPPDGAFYIWTELPAIFRDELEFRNLAFAGNEPLLYLPGALFGGNRFDRHLRFCVCADEQIIEKACRRIDTIINEKHRLFSSTQINP